MQTRVYIWSLPTRVFHWLLVLYILIMIITSDEDSLLHIHSAFGYGIGVLILFRIVWGFIGPEYSKFSQWPLSIKDAIEFITNIFTPKKSYPGHNPAASFVMIGIIVVAFVTVFTGILTYGVQEGKGVLAFLNYSLFKEMEIFEEIHESFFKLLVLLIFAHISGVLVDRVLHKEVDTLKSIVTGYKNIDAKSIKLNLLQKLIAFVFLVASILTPYISLNYQTPLNYSIYKPINYEKEHLSFVEECGSCHTLYPPFLLPANSWKKLMANLENHFGDDASLEKDIKNSIESFLVKNSANTSTKEASVYILKDIKDKNIAITDTSFWKERHAKIDKKIFDSQKVKSKSNCKACHKSIEKGLIEDREIKIPKV